MLISSDPHYGTKSEIPGLNEEIHKIQMEIIEYAIKTKQDYYINLGDIFDVENPDADSVAKVTQWVVMLEANKIKSFLMTGNHDGKSLTHALSFIKEMNLKYVKVIDKPQVIEVEKARFIFIPHITKQMVMKYSDNYVVTSKKKKKTHHLEDEDNFLNDFCRYALRQIDSDKINLAFCHLNVDGALIGPNQKPYKVNKLNVPKMLRTCKQIKYIFCGHIHSGQVIEREGEVPIIIPGSIQRRRFDEINDNKYFIEVDLDEI